jgi:hypothetical protein
MRRGAVVMRAVCLVLVLAAASVTAAQNAARPGVVPPRDAAPGPRTGTASVRGRVTDTDGTPVRRAQVQVMSPATGGPRTTTTDAEGNYVVTGLPAGTYTASASKTGLVSGQFGQRRPGEPGTPVSLSDGQARTRVDIVLRRGGVIAVRVTDEFGDPIAGAQVQVQRYQYGPNGRQLVMSGMSGPGMTDDLGQVRIYGLAPGEYIVGASVRTFNIASLSGADDRSDGYPSTYFPGTANPAEAQSVTVEAGQEAHAQFGLIATRLVRVSGRVVDSQGRPAAGAQLSLATPSGGGFSTVGAGQVQPDGNFTLVRVPPGDHVLRVTSRGTGAAGVFTGSAAGDVVIGTLAGGAVSGLPNSTPGADAESATVAISTSGDDISGLNITTSRPGTISGQLVFQGTSPRPPAGQARVSIQPLDPSMAIFNAVPAGPANGQVAADGTFQLRAMAGKVLFRAAAGTWTLKAITHKGVDVTDEPFDLSGGEDVDGLRIVMTDQTTEVRSMISDDGGKPADGFALVVLPQSGEGVQAQRFTRVMRLGSGGQSDLRGLPPGRYVAMAFSTLEPNAEWNPRVRERVRADGDRFSLTDGQKLTLNLRLAVNPD